MKTPSPSAKNWRQLLQKFRQGIPPGFFRNVSWQFVANIVTLVMRFVYSLLLGRTLGAAEFGLIASGLGFAGLVFNVMEMRLNETVIRYVSEFWEKGDREKTLAVVKLSLLVDAATGCSALFFLALIAPWAQEYLIRDTRGLLVIWLCGLSVFLGNIASATATGVLRIFDQFKSYALVQIGGTTVNLVATLGVIFFMGWGALGVILVGVLSSFLTSIALVSLAFLTLNRRIPWFQTSAPIKLLRPRLPEIRRFALNNYGASLISIPVSTLDINILAYFTSLQVVGVYKIAKNFMSSLWSLSDAFLFAVYPEFAQLWSRKDFTHMRAFIKRLMLGLGLLGILIYVFSSIMVPTIINRVLGSDFSDAGSMFHFMAWSLLIYMPLLWVPSLLLAAGLSNLILRAGFGSALITSSLYLVFIPLWGGHGAALAYGAGAIMGILLALWLGQRTSEMSSI